MARQSRQDKLLQIITNNNIETQHDLMVALKNEGYDVTQATVSRDIQDLGLVKASSDGKRSHYVKPTDPKLAKLKSLFQHSVVSIDGAANMIVIKTIAGAANTACVLVDKLDYPSIMGSIAGDDTLLVIVKNCEDVPGLVKQFQQLMF